MRSPAIPFLAPLLIALALSACGGDAPAGGDGGNGGGGGPSAASARPAVRTAAAPSDPCEWIPADEVASVLGPLAGPPTRVRSADNPEPEPRGNACLYPLAQQPSRGTGAVAVEVSLDGAEIMENVAGAMRGQFDRELSDGASDGQSASPPARPEAAGWDYEGMPLPQMYAGRQGHIGVLVADQSFEIPPERLAALAARVRDRIPDLPFAPPIDEDFAAIMAATGGTEPVPPPSGPDPCTLLTREEAEAVLGKLAAPPYRSSGNTPLAEPGGKSCSYYTGQHRVLTLTPEWSEGGMLFRMASALGGVAGSALPGGESARPLDGPWDRATSNGATGALYLLKGDRMLEVHYQSSSTDLDGALQLARAAVQRLGA